MTNAELKQEITLLKTSIGHLESEYRDVCNERSLLATSREADAKLLKAMKEELTQAQTTINLLREDKERLTAAADHHNDDVRSLLDEIKSIAKVRDEWAADCAGLRDDLASATDKLKGAEADIIVLNQKILDVCAERDAFEKKHKSSESSSNTWYQNWQKLDAEINAVHNVLNTLGIVENDEHNNRLPIFGRLFLWVAADKKPA